MRDFGGGSLGSGNERRDGRDGIDRESQQRQGQCACVNYLTGRHEFGDNAIGCEGPGVGDVLDLSRSRADCDASRAREHKRQGHEDGQCGCRGGKPTLMAHEGSAPLHFHAPIHDAGA